MSMTSRDAPEYKFIDFEAIDGNPLIAHLPSLPNKPTDSFMSLAKKKKVLAKDRDLPSGLRGLLIAQLREFYVPNHETHFRAHSGIATQIVDGYMHRNTLTAEGQALLYGGQRSSTWAPTISLIAGCSGMGKSTLLTQILNSLGPPMVRHTEFRGKPFTESQIIALRKNVPERCTVKVLCTELGSQADIILGQKLYGGIFAKLRGGDRNLVVHEIRKIITNHHVGALVIDEFQNLSLRGTGAADIIAFLVNLRDELGLPIVLCGTYKALELFRNDMTVARRIEEGGYFDLSRPVSADDDSWRNLCSAAWEMQWVRDPIGFSDEICSALYEVSQGVTAIMIAAFRKAQLRAIREESEKVTAALIQRVYDEEMTILHSPLMALRSKDPRLMANFDDLFAHAWKMTDPDKSSPSPQSLAFSRGKGSMPIGSAADKNTTSVAEPQRAKRTKSKSKLSDEEIASDVLGARVSSI